jgi:hypothetical protein
MEYAEIQVKTANDTGWKTLDTGSFKEMETKACDLAVIRKQGGNDYRAIRVVAHIERHRWEF